MHAEDSQNTDIMSSNQHDPKFVWCADFETTGLTNLKKDGFVRVYLWSLVSLDLKQEYHGFNIESFLLKVIELKCKKIWFHNLKFDGSFLIDWLLRRGYECGKDFDCIIDSMNIWYAIDIIVGQQKIQIWDSLKKFPGMSVASIAKMFGYPDKHDKPDFSRYIPDDFIPSDDEIEYCVQDSRIIAYAMSNEYAKGYIHMTLSSDAFSNVKKTLGSGWSDWRKFMPRLSLGEDAFCREAYKGGFVYCNPEYQGKEIKNIKVYDVNSLYPHVMRNCELPVGKGIFLTRKPSDQYLYVVKFTCEFKVKEGYLPTIQIKNNPVYLPTSYLSESLGETTLYLTNIDYDLMQEHYHIINPHGFIYLAYRKKKGALRPYIDFWMQEKIEASKNKQQDRKYRAKRYLNSPYGKTGMRCDRMNRIPILNEDEKVEFVDEISMVDGIYVPYATFTTAQARNITIRSAQKHYNDFLYADTDSLHLKGNDSSGLWVDPYALGAWKLENEFDIGKYLRAKTYIHADKDYNVQEVKCAGMPDDVKGDVTWQNFKPGSEFANKLTQKRVRGGCVLVPTTFKIKKV